MAKKQNKGKKQKYVTEFHLPRLETTSETLDGTEMLCTLEVCNFKTSTALYSLAGGEGAEGRPKKVEIKVDLHSDDAYPFEVLFLICEYSKENAFAETQANPLQTVESLLDSSISGTEVHWERTIMSPGWILSKRTSISTQPFAVQYQADITTIVTKWLNQPGGTGGVGSPEESERTDVSIVAIIQAGMLTQSFYSWVFLNASYDYVMEKQALKTGSPRKAFQSKSPKVI
jgi:hypothetical protein